MTTPAPKMPAGGAEVVTLEAPEQGAHVFDFEVFDRTPGGTNLGRIEWHIEPLARRNRLTGLLVFASQTRDPRYAKRVFWIPCGADGLDGRHAVREPGVNDFVELVWRVAPCAFHRSLVLSAYPGDHHDELVIGVGSSISVDAQFRPPPRNGSQR
jgi:hypothetical protein